MCRIHRWLQLMGDYSFLTLLIFIGSSGSVLFPTVGYVSKIEKQRNRETEKQKRNNWGSPFIWHAFNFSLRKFHSENSCTWRTAQRTCCGRAKQIVVEVVLSNDWKCIALYACYSTEMILANDSLKIYTNTHTCPQERVMRVVYPFWRYYGSNLPL